ncbi:MAG: M18 family aminopeptidase [Eubacteriales bacterium]|nr:M18 family aminopeptidase [Eubacteriales bacterium]
MYQKAASEMMTFIKKSPTAFHAVDNMKKILQKNGYKELVEAQAWELVPQGKYFVTRNGSSILALHLGEELSDYNFHIAASHSDSPTFKVKENAQIEVRGKYTQLNTEGYGGMLCAPWLDRPLSIAGRAIVKCGEDFVTKLVDFDRDLVMIPSMAIHMNRGVNESASWNKQIDMLPLFGSGEYPNDLLKTMVAKLLSVEKEDIYGMDLFLYNRMAPSVWGAKEEYISCPQLDDLQSAYTSLQGFLRGYQRQTVNVFACFDNEEVGSGTKQGAASTFLYDVLTRVNAALGKTPEEYRRALAASFLLSCDNAHAVHPNHPEKTDVGNCVYMNEGIVIKSHAGQKYTSDAVSIALFRRICEQAEVPVQFFANRSDEPGGSTLGNISMEQVSMNAVDIGLAQLAMHSPYETAGVKDGIYMMKAVEQFYKSRTEVKDSGVLTLKM